MVVATSMDQLEQEEEYYVAEQESCIFNCPYVEDQVKAEVDIEQEAGAVVAAAAVGGGRPGATAIGGSAGGEYYEEDQDDTRYYDQQYYYDHPRGAFDDFSLYSYGHHQQRYFSTMLTAVGDDTEELIQGEEFRLDTSSAGQQQHDGEEQSASSSRMIRNGPRPPFVAQEEHEVRGASNADYPSSSSSCSGLVGMTSHYASSTTNKSSSTRTREKHSSSPEDINFLLKWRYLQAVSTQQQSARFMSSMMGYPLSTVPEQEELVEVRTITTNSASSSGSFKPSNHPQDHSRDSVGEGGLLAPRIMRSFPNIGPSQDTTSLLDYDLSTSQDDETSINNNASLSFQEDDC